MRYEAGDSINGYYGEIAGLFQNCIIDPNKRAWLILWKYSCFFDSLYLSKYFKYNDLNIA